MDICEVCGKHRSENEQNNDRYKTQIAKMYNSKFKKTEGKIRSLKLALNSIVFKMYGFGDLVAGNNCGWIGKNLVAVDFGDFSV